MIRHERRFIALLAPVLSPNITLTQSRYRSVKLAQLLSLLKYIA